MTHAEMIAALMDELERREALDADEDGNIDLFTFNKHRIHLYGVSCALDCDEQVKEMRDAKREGGAP